MLENKNPPTPNPTLNLPDSVNEYKSEIKGIHWCNSAILALGFELLC